VEILTGDEGSGLALLVLLPQLSTSPATLKAKSTVRRKFKGRKKKDWNRKAYLSTPIILKDEALRARKI
jgi:hypothetical protein